MGNDKTINDKTGNQNTDNRKADGNRPDDKKSGGQKSRTRKPRKEKARSRHSAAERSAKQTLPPHRRRCIIIKDAKHRGEWTELVFMCRAAERGFNVSKPWGDSSRYDCAVERGGRFLRVQVKSTIARQFKGYIVTIKSRSQGNYTRHQVDLFAIYVIPEDVWYILPAKIITILRSNFLLSPHSPRQKYAAYKEAWHLLKSACQSKPATSLGKPLSRRDI